MDKKNRVFNFSAGPSMLPLEVLEKAASEMTNANGSGQSVMEMSHRSADFYPIIESAQRRLRSLLSIPDNYHVLFLQGGAMLQFSMVPMNLGSVEGGKMQKTATYIDTGVWASKAATEAKKYLKVNVAASSKDKNYTYIPAAPSPSKNDAYYHICLNNTIVGTKWGTLPDTGDVPLVADASSCILSEPLDVQRFGLIYAGAQKNLGPAGCTLVIVRDDLVGYAPSTTPIMLDYQTHVSEKSLFNTPPVWCIYVIDLVLQQLQEKGGLSAMQKINMEKAAILYDCLDNSSMFCAPVEKPFRSLMNVPFVFKESNVEKKAALEKRFHSEAAAQGMINLAGHRVVGGLRASIYNAMPRAGIDKLCRFIQSFK
ncbi:MAG: 3-phosphoserine/phosphohydroxythreonine transaminase [Termitinemataceae bacterium]|nr:MAG: 3-phosphoserine/phosphohydroxythreonine transaminase [Termitinemataceae bacterium]